MGFDDVRRLKALREYQVLDTAPEPAFDAVVQLASRIFRTPIALLSLLDESRQWFKARVGMEATATPREYAFCDHAIRSSQTMVVNDAAKDERFSDNPFVTGAPGVRFYCGVPVRTPDGEALGTLCLMDTRPREIDAPAVALLESLAHQVEVELELRRRLLLLEGALQVQQNQRRSRELLASMVVHDLRGPLTTISMAAAAVQPADAESKVDLADIATGVERMRRMLGDILDVCLYGVGELRLRPQFVCASELAREVGRSRAREAAQRKQTLELDIPAEAVMSTFDPEFIERVLSNLVLNAMSHGPPNQPITLCVRAVPGGGMRAEVRDLGTLIPEEVRTSIFEALDRAGKRGDGGHGLGLAFCRLAVRAHGGVIGVEPNQPRGNRFFFEIPPTLPT